MAQRTVGSHISLLSNSEIRYDGFLHSIDPTNNTISLVNVHILGTEGRKNGVDEVPPSDQLFEYIVFSGCDIQNITLYEEQAPVSADPAIVSAGPARTVTGGAAAVTAAGSPPTSATAIHHIKADEPGGKINLNSVARPGHTGGEGNASANTNSHDNRNHNAAPSGRARRGGMTGGSNRLNSRYDNNNHNYNSNNSSSNNNNNNHNNNNHAIHHSGGTNRRDNGVRNTSHGGGGSGGGSAGGRYNRGGSAVGDGYGGRGGAAAAGGGHYRRRQEGHTGQDFQPATGAQKEEFKEEFDFKRSQAELDAKSNEFEKAKEDAKTYAKVYNKSSFFDHINNDQKERTQNSRVDRDEVKRADAETFGQEMVGAMRGFRRGRGGRGRYNRY